MKILDIHTHHLPPVSGQAICSVSPMNFAPQQGCYYSVGFHPWYLSDDGSEDWEVLNEVLSSPQVLALGEAGLDKVTKVDYALQEAAFERQVSLALIIQKPLIIHCVRSFNELIEYKKSFNPDNPWIIHGFRGKKELAKQLVNQGFFLSFGFHYQEDALCATPLDRLFLETDESREHITSLYMQAATHLSLSVSKLTEQIEHNVSRVFFDTKSCSFK